MAKRKSTKTTTRRDIYQEITDRIVGYLEQGTAPWRNPIKRGTGDGWPRNIASGKRYRGINVFLLTMRAFESGYRSDYWMTFKQAKAAGGEVRKGEKGTLVTFWKMYATEDKETGDKIDVPVLRHYTTFNVEQIDGINSPDAPIENPDAKPFDPLAEADRVVAGYPNPPVILHHDGTTAFYQPTTDKICIPKAELFDTREDFYCTLFHEMSHSTGHSKRLDRGLDRMSPVFGAPDYSREELVAEMSAAFLCAASGISPSTIEQSAAYLQGWINTLKGDKRLVINAAGAAQKSAEWILGDSFNDAAEPSMDHNIPGSSVKQSLDAAPPDADNEAQASQLDLF